MKMPGFVLQANLIAVGILGFLAGMGGFRINFPDILTHRAGSLRGLKGRKGIPGIGTMKMQKLKIISGFAPDHSNADKKAAEKIGIQPDRSDKTPADNPRFLISGKQGEVLFADVRESLDMLL